MSSRFVVACATLLFAATALADELALDALLPSLRQGGYVIVLRHGATDARSQDVYPLDYADPTKQRRLSDQGRETARDLGRALDVLGIPIGQVFTSRLDRAVETGRLVAGKDVMRSDELTDSGMGSAAAMTSASLTGNERYATALRRLAATPPVLRANTLVVTHKTNIQDAFGSAWADVREGECLLFRPDGTADPRPLARVQAGDWIARSRSASPAPRRGSSGG